MGVFKEEAHTFETVAQKQSQIFNDAADYGFPYKRQSPPAPISELLASVASLKKLDGDFPKERPFLRNRTTWGEGDNEGVSVDVIIFWEEDEGYYCGTKYAISFNKMKPNHPSNLHKGCDSFINVHIEPYKELS